MNGQRGLPKRCKEWPVVVIEQRNNHGLLRAAKDIRLQSGQSFYVLPGVNISHPVRDALTLPAAGWKQRNPFFLGAGCFKRTSSWVWKTSYSNEKTLVGKVLINAHCFITFRRHRDCCRCSRKAGAYMRTRGHSKERVQQGAPCCSASPGALCLLRSSWIHHTWFYRHNWGAEQAARWWGMMRRGSGGCLQNHWEPNLPISKGQDLIPSLMCTVLTHQSCFSSVKDAKTPYPWEKPWEFNFNKAQFDLFSAAFLSQLVATPTGHERQLEDTRHLKSYYSLK